MALRCVAPTVSWYVTRLPERSAHLVGKVREGRHGERSFLGRELRQGVRRESGAEGSGRGGHGDDRVGRAEQGGHEQQGDEAAAGRQSEVGARRRRSRSGRGAHPQGVLDSLRCYGKREKGQLQPVKEDRKAVTTENDKLHVITQLQRSESARGPDRGAGYAAAYCSTARDPQLLEAAASPEKSPP